MVVSGSLKNGCPLGEVSQYATVPTLFLGGEPWKLHGLGDVQNLQDPFLPCSCFRRFRDVMCFYSSNFGREFHHVTSHRFDDL